MYSPSFYGTLEPSLSSLKALGIVKQNKAHFTKIVYMVLFSIILYFLFKHWSMNHVLPLLVCWASSEDSLPSGRFQHGSLYQAGGTRHRETTNGVESFSVIVTEALWSNKNPRTGVAPRLLQLGYYHPHGSEEISGELILRDHLCDPVRL